MMEKSPDLSKIIGLIMENPDVIERIKNLTSTVSDSSTDEKKEVPNEILSDASDTFEQASSQTATAPKEKNGVYDKKRRTNLLYAIKPYVSENRSKAIDTMLSVMEVIDVIKER